MTRASSHLLDKVTTPTQLAQQPVLNIASLTQSEHPSGVADANQPADEPPPALAKQVSL